MNKGGDVSRCFNNKLIGEGCSVPATWYASQVVKRCISSGTMPQKLDEWRNMERALFRGILSLLANQPSLTLSVYTR